MGADSNTVGRVRAYLDQVPGHVQASLRRPEDPTGRTIPGGMTLRKAADLERLLPSRMPRFQDRGTSPSPVRTWSYRSCWG